MIIAVAPAGLTERQRGGVGGAAAEVTQAPPASAGPGVAAPQVISHTYVPLPTLTDSATIYAEVATSPPTPTAVIRADCGGPGQQQQPHTAPPGAVHSTAKLGEHHNNLV